MAVNLVNGSNIVVEENGDNINMDLSSTYTNQINNRFGVLEYNGTPTNETKTGFKMNGKDVYCKIIEVSNLGGSTGDKPISCGDLVVNDVEMINVFLYLKRSTSNWWYVTSSGCNNSTNLYLVYINGNSNSLIVHFNENMTVSGNVYLYYYYK